MNIPSVKLISAVIGLGGVTVGVGFGINSYLSNSTIENKEGRPKTKKVSEWLDLNGFLVLKDSEDNDQWKTNWSTFIDENGSKNTLDSAWNIESWTTRKGNKTEVPTDFKTNCKTNSDLEIDKKTDEKYEKVRKYCTKPKATG